MKLGFVTLLAISVQQHGRSRCGSLVLADQERGLRGGTRIDLDDGMRRIKRIDLDGERKGVTRLDLDRSGPLNMQQHNRGSMSNGILNDQKSANGEGAAKFWDDSSHGAKRDVSGSVEVRTPNMQAI
jgi:hypothetical protein